jgi:hypothetical protein
VLNGFLPVAALSNTPFPHLFGKLAGVKIGGTTSLYLVLLRLVLPASGSLIAVVTITSHEVFFPATQSSVEGDTKIQHTR